MNDMRFGQPDNRNFNPHPHTPPPPPVQSYQPEYSEKRSGFGVWKYLLGALLFVLLAGGGFYAWKVFGGSDLPSDPTASEYYAVFLTNGQVYFGKPVSKDAREFVLSDVFYLQAESSADAAQTQLNEPRFNLVKLGKEIHRPTDMLYVNMANLLFYEQLEADSEVVKSIKNYQK